MILHQKDIIPRDKRMSVALGIKVNVHYYLGLPRGSVVKNLPAVQELQARSLGWEDPLEEGMATLFSVLAWRIPWTEEPRGLQFIEF